MDQSENTSWLILIGQGFGILLEMWKVTKTVNIRVQRSTGLLPFKVIFEDKHVLNEKEAETQEYDKIAFVKSSSGFAHKRHTCIGPGSLYYLPMRCILYFTRNTRAGIVILSQLLLDSCTPGDSS